jgi:competence protein ComEA
VSTRPFADPILVDINEASIPELMTLPGMGRSRAAAVVLHRVRHGRFSDLEEMLAIDGIGAHTLALMRPHLIDPARTGGR